ncbi:hypothetical protein [Larkinella arboricola]|nr:hypothetical protein [Larkinella arboricola]
MKTNPQSAFATTVMALKILLLLIFQNKPLLLFQLTCYSMLARLQAVFYVVLLHQSFYRR